MKNPLWKQVVTVALHWLPVAHWVWVELIAKMLG